MLLSSTAVAKSGEGGSFVDIDVPAVAWAGLLLTIVVMLSIDLMLHRGDKKPTPGRALIESLVWVACGLSFGLVVWATWGGAGNPQADMSTDRRATSSVQCRPRSSLQ